MVVSLARYLKTQKIDVECETVTPLFLGNAHQEAELRSAPFKWLLRYWWRITQWDQPGWESLLQAESQLFGSAGDSEAQNAGKSIVGVRVSPVGTEMASSQQLGGDGPSAISHPECEKLGCKVDPLLYLAGMGIMKPKGEVKHKYIPPLSRFKLLVRCPCSREDDLKAAFALIRAFGAVGARCRNGWGSLQVKTSCVLDSDAKNLISRCVRNWEDGFKRDYPNCLGRDEKGSLFWKTMPSKSWEGAMRSLAEAYIGVRAREVHGIPKLNPNGNPGERHLLGIPLTNHPVSGWEGGRHASALRFIVHKTPEGFQGFVLHLPHKFSDKMNIMSKGKQIDTWRIVHKKLDCLLKRASYGECL